MAKYFFRGNYVGVGVKGLMAEGGSARRDAAAKAMESLGGRLESFYYAFGETDVLGVVEMPDEASAVAASLLINSSGAVSLNLTPLLDPDVLDAASNLEAVYTPPGG